MMKNHHQDKNNESKSLLLPHSKKKNATPTNTAGNTSSSSSSSSSLFVESLSKAFLVAVAIMGLSLCVQFREQHHHHLHRSQPPPPPPPQEGRTEEHRRKLLTDSTTSTSTGHHQWALDRGFGFPSAFEDSLYAASSSASSLDSLSSVMEKSSMEQTCPPQRLHLTQATNVEYDKDNEDGPVVDMMLSLTLPYKPDCGGEDNNDKVQLTVVYGRGVYPEGSSSSSDAASDDEVIQFAYDASLAVPGLDDYQSDYIHHIALKGLQAGRQTYWYRVYVTEQAAPPAEKTKDDNRHYNAAARVLSKTLLSYSRNHPHYLVAATAASSTRNLRQQEESPQHNEADQRIIFLGDSMVHTFQTPPVAHQATSLALVGDLGQTENSTKTMQRILSKSAAGGLFANTYQDDDDDDDETAPPVTALIIAGDLSYSDGDPRRWTSWLELMEPLLRSMPLFSVPGNHEIECDNTTHQVFGQYESYFRNPNRLGPADRQPIPDDYRRTLWSCLTSSEFLGHYNYGNAFWSVDHGLAKIIGLNSYTSTLPGSPQYLWLDHELKNNVDRSETPWLIVTFHCPLHTTFRGHNGEVNALLMLKSMEPLFVQYQVNFVVSGHDHAYLRTKPMQGTEAADDHDDDDKKTGPIYLTLGAGGNREQHNKGYIHDIPEDWVVKRDLSEYGFGHLHLPNATHAHLTWVRDGTTEEGIRDSVWLPNQYSSSSDYDSSQNDHYRLRSSEHQAEMKYSR